MTIINEVTKTVKRVSDPYVDLCIKAGLPVRYALSRGIKEDDLREIEVDEYELDLNY